MVRQSWDEPIPPFLTRCLGGGNGGFALVLVLAMLVLVAGLITAYFSRALQERRTTFSSTSNASAEFLAQAGLEILLADFRHEMVAGSHDDPLAMADGSVRSILRPLLVEAAGDDAFPVAPSIVAQQVGITGVPGVIKTSRASVPFFLNGEGYQGNDDGPVRAADSATDQPSISGRLIETESWNLPKLMSDDEFGASFVSPDWIYINRAGNTPVDFDGERLAEMASAEPENERFVMGRFAYVIYDVGGLLDINVAGNALPESENARRGRLHQVGLSEELGGGEWPEFQDWLEEWRWPLRAGNEDWLFDPENSFRTVEDGHQAFVGRRDFLRYAEESGAGFPNDALPFLTVFNRDLDAPHWEPDPWRNQEIAEADEFNPAILEIRFSEETTLDRGADPEVTVPAGTSVLPRRFPLSKLALFEEDNPDPDSMRYYFGLEAVSEHVWEYVAGIEEPDPDNPGESLGVRIARLHEVAESGREPNFFELLQAVFLTGSLGKSGGDTATLDHARDSLRNLQVMQIGANIIDQWDADDIPTTLLYPSGDFEDPFIEIYGIENLPYLNQMALISIRPEFDRELLQFWLAMDVWNPHQNAGQLPSGIARFRVVPRSGRARQRSKYNLRLRSPPPIGDLVPGQDYDPLADVRVSPYESIVALNEERELEFDLGSYTEPTLIGDGNPVNESDMAGILLGEKERPPPIARKEDRPADVQLEINHFQDFMSPYSHTLPEDESGSYPLINDRGEREYPLGTQFSGLDEDHWTHETRDGSEVVYGNFGTKTNNLSQLQSQEPIDLEVQLLPVGGEWMTYQRVESFIHWVNSSLSHSREYIGEPDGIIFQHTHHSSIDPEEVPDHFYHWRTPENKHHTATITYSRADPRTHRFGFGSTTNDWLELSIRSSPTPWTGTSAKTNLNWLRMEGSKPGTPGDHGFEFWDSNRYVPYGLITNTPDLPAGELDGAHPTRYADNDGVIRPGDGYFGSHPTLPGNFEPRPVVLNRPFRSVGELGYVFRDMPWKTIDFSTRQSGDLGLLDVFGLDALPEDQPVRSGQVNLNTQRPEVLAALLSGAMEQLGGIHSSVPSEVISSSEARLLADAIVAETGAGPVTFRGDLVGRVFGAASSPLESSAKVRREAAIRALSEMGTTRTWNFMIDLVAQSGRFTSEAQGPEDFLVQGQRRIWVHVAMDRMTGEILEIHKEAIHD